MTKTSTSPFRGAAIVGFVLILSISLALPSGSATAGELLEIRGDQFTLDGPPGYRTQVVGSPGGDKPTVTLYAKRADSEVEYTAPGKVTEEEMRAKFGSLGSVDVNFQPSGQTREAINYCDSSHPTVAVELGTFVGTIDFRGERGYTRVTSNRAQGGVGNDAALPDEPESASCKPLTTADIMQKPQSTSLAAITPKSPIYFDAIATTEVEGGGDSSTTPHVFFAAGSSSKEGGLEIRRLV